MIKDKEENRISIMGSGFKKQEAQVWQMLCENERERDAQFSDKLLKSMPTPTSSCNSTIEVQIKISLKRTHRHTHANKQQLT